MTLQLDMFDFLIKPIRDADRNIGHDFLRRFLQGPQQLWSDTHDKIDDIKELWSVLDCPDEYLQYLKWIVGWTSEPELVAITDGLTYVQLRRLISISTRLWKERGPEDTIADILRNLTGQRVRLWNWFDWRMLVGEVELGEEQAGFDPWLIDDPYTFQVRIVDPGSSARLMVRQIVNLMRATGETIEIAYLTFLDQFTAVGDSSQWERDGSGSGAITVAGGMVQLDSTAVVEIIKVNLTGATSWDNYSVSALVQSSTSVSGAGPRLLFYHTDSDNYYEVHLDIVDNELELIKIVSGIPTTITTVDLATKGMVVYNDQWYTLRTVVVDESSSNRIKIYLDAEEIVDTTDSAHSAGTVALSHKASADLLCKIVEVFAVPMDTDTIAPNYSE